MNQANKNYPFEIVKVRKELEPKYGEHMILVGPKKICLYETYKDEVLPQFYNFKSRPDDVWLFGFPRCGTTLTQELVWLLGNDLDYEKAAEDIMDVRFPVFELSGYMGKHFDRLKKEKHTYRPDIQKIIDKWARNVWDALEEQTSRRFIKTHMPISLARNPKDALVSCFLLHNNFEDVFKDKQIEKGFESAFNIQVNTNNFFTIIKEGWELRHHKNVLFLFYEEYKKDFRKTILKVAKFMERSLTEDELIKLEDHLNIENFRNNKSVNNDHLRELGLMNDKDYQFIRKGKSGEWKDYFKDKLNEKCDEWIKENLKDTDLKFPEV